MNASSSQHRLDFLQIGTFLFFPETPAAASVNIQFYAFDRSAHDVVIQFPPTALCAGRGVFTFTRSATGTAHTFDIEAAREIWNFLLSTGWSINKA